jgi:hypothetical protein
MQTYTATPTKLRNGSWGARVGANVQPGDIVRITTKAGKSWDATVAKVIWTGDGVSICATSSGASRNTYYTPSRRRPGCCSECGDRLQPWMDGYAMGLCHDCL